MTRDFMIQLQPAFANVRHDGECSYIKVPSNLESPLEILKIELQRRKPHCITLWRMNADGIEVGFDRKELSHRPQPVHTTVLALLKPGIG